MKKFTAGVLGAFAIAASLVLVRQQRTPPVPEGTVRPHPKSIPAGETVPADVSPDRLRELGL